MNPILASQPLLGKPLNQIKKPKACHH
jgi:hypothetical protein